MQRAVSILPRSGAESTGGGAPRPWHDGWSGADVPIGAAPASDPYPTPDPMDTTPPAGAPDDFAMPDTELSVPRPSGDSLAWEPLLTAPPAYAEASGDGAAPEGLTMEDVTAASKIREILFGQHMAEYDRRFTQLEVRLAREVEQLRKEATGRIDGLESRLTQDVAGLARQIETERKGRAKDVAEMTDQFRTARQELEAAIDKSTRDAEASVVHLRHALQEETARQRRALEERTEELERHLDTAAQSLRRDKVDRSSLQVLFEQLSVHFGTEAPASPAV